MAGWLSRATSLFQQTPPPPEPFEVECDCGAKVVGQRISTYQKPACSRCERPVFVLPANIYPQVKQKSKSRSSKGKGGSKSDRTSTAVVDDDPDQTPQSQPSRTDRNAKAAKAPAVIEQQILLEPPSPWITPLRVTTTAIFLVGVATIAGLWYRHRIEKAQTAISQSADAGMAALKEEDFLTASRELQRASDAVDVLGRTDATSNEIRRLSRESTTLANLSSSTLTEILDETIAAGKRGQTEPLRLSVSNKGAWVIFDARVTPVSGGRARCLVDAPFFVGDATVRIEVDSPAVRSVSQPDPSGQQARVIFAAQLESLTAPTGQPPISVLTLNAKTAFLWTSYDTYKAIGYRPIDAENDEQTSALLKRQLEARPN